MRNKRAGCKNYFLLPQGIKPRHLKFLFSVLLFMLLLYAAGSADAACTRNYPSVHFTPTSGIVSAVAAKAYTVTITNNDKEDTPGDCGASTFALSISSETGDIGSFVIPSTLGSGTTGSLAVAGRYNTTLTVTAAGTITEGHKLTSIVQAVDNTNHSGKTGKGSVVTKASAYIGDGMILRRAEEETCHACHKTDRNRTPSDADWNQAIKTHSSVSLGSSKWSAQGGWGVAGGKYGEFVCTTCHTAHSTANIYVIKETITAPNSPTDSFPGSTVDFRTKSGTAGVTLGTMGDDTAGHATSTRVCEVCHSQTNYHKYNQATDPGHNNATDCTSCHTHKIAFGGGGACNSCHGAPPGYLTGVVEDTNAPAQYTASHAKHYDRTAGGLITSYVSTAIRSTAGAYVFDCGRCHNNVAGTHTADTNGTVDVLLPLGGTFTPGSYTGGDNPPPPGSVTFKNSNGTCSNVYCHGNFAGSGITTNTPTWGGSAACGTCHGASAASPPAGGSHSRHVGGATMVALACDMCHEDTATGSSINSRVFHVNEATDWNLKRTDNRLGASATYKALESGSKTPPSTTYSSCSSIYCHSNVQGALGVGAPTSYDSPTWGGAALTCATSCHSGTPATGKHGTHTSVPYSYACSRCHNGAGDETANHANYSIDMSFNLAFSYTSGSYSQSPNTPGGGYGSCSNLYCHSIVQTTSGGALTGAIGEYLTPSWGGGALACTGCHGNPSASGSHTKHATTYSYACSRCHNGQVPPGVATHADGSVNTAIEAGWSTASNAYNGTTTPGDGYSTCANTYCHSKGTGGTSEVGDTRPIEANTSPTWGGSTTCESCHGGEVLDGSGLPAYANGTPKANSHVAHSSKTCDVCHYPTTTDGSTIASYTNHVNKTYQVNNSASTITYTYVLTGGSCGGTFGCHAGATWGGASMDCVSCHSAALGNRRTITGASGDFVRASRHVSNGTTTEIVTKWDCVVCHLEGQATGVSAGRTSTDHTGTPNSNADVNLRNVDSYTTGWVWNNKGATPDTIMRNNMDRFCLSCHDSDASADTNVTMTASGSGAQSWTALGGTVDYLNLLTNDADTTYYWTTANNAYHTNAIHDISSSVSGTVDTVTVYGVCRGEATGNTMRLVLRIGGTNYDGATNNSLTISYATYSQTWATNPAGGSWTWTAINGMEAGFKSTTMASVQRCTQMYIAVSASGTNFDIGTGTKLVWGSNLGGASTIAVNGTNNGLLTGSAVARRFTPFNTSDNQQNAKEVDTDIRTARANSGVKDIRGMFNSQSLVGKGWASHHNLNIFEKRYSARNATAWPDAAWTTWTTREGQSIRTAGESAGLHCSDCHLNEINAHGSATTYYMLSNNAGNDTAFTNVGKNTATDICSKCHANTTYGEGNTSTASRTQSHNQNGRKCSNISNADNRGPATLGSTTEITATKGYTDLTCLGCHGGITFGGIHGQNNAYQPGKTGAGVPTYRFMGTGGSMRWYSPDAAINPTDADWESSTATPGCYTISAVDNFGGCTEHGNSFDSDRPVNRGRPLQY